MARPGNRAFQILKIGGAVKGRCKHGEIAQALHILKSSLSELPSSLVARDYLTIDTISGTYAIGPQALVLANSYLASLYIVQIAQPTVRQAMIKTGESASLNYRCPRNVGTGAAISLIESEIFRALALLSLYQTLNFFLRNNDGGNQGYNSITRNSCEWTSKGVWYESRSH
jgi:hypothetical protein